MPDDSRHTWDVARLAEARRALSEDPEVGP